MISFVVPVTYNVSPFLEETIYSLLTQKGNQIVIVYNNDLHKDIERFIDQFPTIQFVKSDKQSIPDLLNLSRNHIKNLYVSLVSQYAEFYPEKTIVQITNMEECKSEISYCAYRVLKQGPSIPYEYSYSPCFPVNDHTVITKKHLNYFYGEGMIDISNINNFNFSGIVLLKTLFDAYEFKDLNVLYGYEYLARVSEKYPISFCHNPLFVYNTGPFIYLNNAPMINKLTADRSMQEDIRKIYDRS